jgi:hypothetical protein
MNDTNIIVTGNGTAGDPYTYNIHTTGQSIVMTHGMLAIIIILVGLAAVGGFLLGFNFGVRRKKLN